MVVRAQRSPMKRSCNSSPSTHPTLGSTSPQFIEPVLPNPPSFGFDERKFPIWRMGQSHAVSDIVMADHIYLAMVCPTGFGKSLMYMVAAVINGGRALILTSTNPLSHQIMDDFGIAGVCVQIKGKSNYRCKLVGRNTRCDQGPCNYGKTCGYKAFGCEYYDEVRRAAKAQIVVTNYSYWIYNNKASAGEDIGIGSFDLIVCDEAHDSPNKVADAYTVRFSKKNDVEEHLLQPFKWGNDKQELFDWATSARDEAEKILADAKIDSKIERAAYAANALRKLKDIIRMWSGSFGEDERDNIILVPDKKWGILRVALAWPFDRAKQVLFRGAKKVVLTSATIRPRTLRMLGVGEEEQVLFEYPHIIPQSRRMLYHIPCVRLNYKSQKNPSTLRTWRQKADNIFRTRLDRNNIFHTVSYARRDMVIRESDHRQFMLTHQRKNTQDIINDFKSPPYGEKILVSPSVTTGYDFPHDTARCQIIGKLAFPDTSDPITKARCDLDDDYSPYIAMQTLVQTTGRIVRAADDWGETFIIDDNIKWFIHKYADFAPDWFKGSYQSVRMIPKPPTISKQKE